MRKKEMRKEMELNKNNVIENAYDKLFFTEKKQTKGIQIYCLNNDTGTGKMRCYNLLEGIQLSYNTLNMQTTYQKIEPKEGMLQIDHCLEGCYEFILENNEHAFLGSGDLSIVDLGKALFKNSCIPMKRYVGLSLFIDINVAQKSIDKYFPYGNIDLHKLRDRLCKNGVSLIIRSRDGINHIINELYEVDERVKLPYSIIKTIELLLFLGLVESKDTEQFSSFSEPVYRATQECYKMIIENPFEWMKIRDLAKKFAVSESSLKNCFQCISGKSIGAFMRENRIKEASILLNKKPYLSIGELAEMTGYENQSKFSKAFKSIMGKNPSEFK